ncbi:hypothetical protein OUZ56_033602 [Daphnia magna]|uniref:Uncharacterized protein n=1 Tax=Daphnia magna TaxID=35525 RepID=A0ABR0BB74_9CRUS|nr:hypothetical protein OUZ56_033602 [Daphnia magna]
MSSNSWYEHWFPPGQYMKMTSLIIPMASMSLGAGNVRGVAFSRVIDVVFSGWGHVRDVDRFHALRFAEKLAGFPWMGHSVVPAACPGIPQVGHLDGLRQVGSSGWWSEQIPQDDQIFCIGLVLG